MSPFGLNTQIIIKIKPYKIKSTAPPVPPKYILEYSEIGIRIDAPIIGPQTFPIPPRTVINKTITINKNINGIEVIMDALLLINKIYKIINKAERIKKVFLKTLIIKSECFIRL